PPPAATGTHVLFLDADDLLAPEALARLSEAAASRPGAIALMGCVWFDSDSGESTATRRCTTTAFFPKIIESNFAPPHCWLAPLDVIRRAGAFDERVSIFEDWDLWWRVGLESPPIVLVDYIGARYRQHRHSQLATTPPPKRAQGHADLMARMVTAFFTRPELLAAHGDQLFWSAWTALKVARARGIKWPELHLLTTQIRRLASEGPDCVTHLRLAVVIRRLGLPMALPFHHLVTRLAALARPLSAR
ncbi:MAG: glycosyltransferase, partial [Vicinamibacterales bacterium]